MNPLLIRNFTAGNSIDLPGSSARSEREFVALLNWRLRSDSYSMLKNELSDLMDDRIRASKYKDIVLGNAKKKRPISIPEPILMSVQRWILPKLPHHLLNNAVYAYVPGRSAIQCASRHIGMTWGVKVDISSFFHQIREQDIVHLFRSWGFSKFSAVGYAKLLTQPHQLLSHSDAQRPGGRLPQGAPTSGAIANFVCMELDSRLTRFAEINGLTYTRYSDDIMLSSKNPLFSRDNAAELLREISSLMKHFGLSLNNQKTRVYGPSAAKHYLGCRIDTKTLRVPRHYRRQIESVFYCLEKFGLSKTEEFYGEGLIDSVLGEEASSIKGKKVLLADEGKTSFPAAYFITRFVGQLVYINQIDQDLAIKFATKCAGAIQRDKEFFQEHYSEYVKVWVSRSLKSILRQLGSFDEVTF